MIRQPASTLIAKEKAQINHLFYPAKEKGNVIVSDWYGNNIRVNLSTIAQENAPCVTPLDYAGNSIGDTISLDEYVNEYHRDTAEHQFRAQILCAVFEKSLDKSAFDKQDYVQYYHDQMRFCPDNRMRCTIHPMHDGADRFEAKFEYTKKLLRKHSGERILVFFDYELKKSELVHDRFERAILQDPEFKDRVIVGTSANKEKTLEIFDSKENAILVIKDASFTEGVNLQLSNIIINFQVTPDPLAMDQRIGRIFRLGQRNNVIIYSLADMSKLEGFALMYFVRIGLMSSNSGDATIIAGSNNERMVAVQCDRWRTTNSARRTTSFTAFPDRTA